MTTYEQYYGDYLNDELDAVIYSPNMVGYDVFDMSLSYGVNGTSGELTEVIAPTHPNAELISKNDPENFLECRRDGQVFWRGICVNDGRSGEAGMSLGHAQMTFVGELSLACDMPCPAYDYAGNVAGFVQLMLDALNEYWAARGRDNWRWKIGHVDEMGGIIASNTGQEDGSTVYTELYGRLVASDDESAPALGAMMYLSYESDGVHLNVVDPLNQVVFPFCTADAMFGRNIDASDFSYSSSVVNQYTCIEPLGASMADTDYMGRFISEYDELEAKPSDWAQSYSSSYVRRIMTPLSSEPDDWAINDGVGKGWRKYYALRFTQADPESELWADMGGGWWATFERLDSSYFGLTTAPDFLASTGPDNKYPDGPYAPVYYEATVTDPTQLAAQTDSQWTQLEGCPYVKVSKRPSDWAESSSSYYLGHTDDTYGLLPGWVARSICPADYEVTTIGEDGEEVTTLSQHMVPYNMLVPRNVECEYSRLTSSNFKTLTGSNRTYTYKGKTYSNWSTNKRLYTQAYVVGETHYDPVHKCNVVDSYVKLGEVYDPLEAKPSGWASDYTSYFVKKGGRDLNLYPKASSAACSTHPYYPVPAYRRKTTAVTHWDNYVTGSGDDAKLNAGKYSSFYVFNKIDGAYQQISKYQPVISKPSAWSASNWSKEDAYGRKLCERYYVYKGGSFVTLKKAYTKKTFPAWSAGKFFAAEAPTCKLDDGVLKVHFATKVKGTTLPAGWHVVYAKDAASTRVNSGNFQVRNKTGTEYSYHTVYKSTIPSFFASTDDGDRYCGPYFWPVAKTWSETKADAGAIYRSADASAPGFELSRPVYVALDAADVPKLDLRDEWVPDEAFTDAEVAGEYDMGEAYELAQSLGVVKDGRYLVLEDAAAEYGPRTARVTFADATSANELAVAAMLDLVEASNVSVGFEFTPLDLGDTDASQMRPGRRIRCWIETLGLTGEAFLCEQVSDLDFTRPASGKIKVGSSWITEASASSVSVASGTSSVPYGYAMLQNRTTVLGSALDEAQANLMQAAADLDELNDELNAKGEELAGQIAGVADDLAAANEAISAKGEELAERVAQNADDIAAANATISAKGEELAGQIADANEAILANEAAIIKEVSDREGADAALALSIDGLAARVTNAEGDIGTLTLTSTTFGTRLADAEGNISTISQDVSTIDTRVTSVEGDVSSLTVDVEGIAARVTDAEGDIATLTLTTDGLGSRITDAEGSIGDLVLTSTSYGTRIADAEGNISTISQDVSTIDLRVTGVEGDVSALTVDVEGIAARVTSAEGSISTLTLTTQGLGSRITDAEGSIGDLVLTSNSYGTRITNAEGSISTISQDVSAIDTRVTSAEGSISALTVSVDGIATRVGTAEGNITKVTQTATALGARIESAEGKVTTITATVDGLQVTVDSVADDAASALNRATYRYGTCATAASTAAKVVACSGFSRYAGAQVAVKFTYANTAASPTLNVNGTGAASIRAYGSALTSTSDYNWAAGAVVLFTFDGTYWCITDASSLYRASAAAKTATNYMSLTSSGLVVGNYTVSTLTGNVLISANPGVYLRNGTTVLASFEPDEISLGNASSATISLCGSSGTINVLQASYKVDGDIENKTFTCLSSNSTYNAYVGVCGSTSASLTSAVLHAGNSYLMLTGGGLLSLCGKLLAYAYPQEDSSNGSMAVYRFGDIQICTFRYTTPVAAGYTMDFTWANPFKYAPYAFAMPMTSVPNTCGASVGNLTATGATLYMARAGDTATGICVIAIGITA